MIPQTHVRVIAEGERPKEGELGCSVDREVRIAPEVLSAYCFQPLSDRVYDLILLAASVAFTDKTVPRHAAYAWRRELRLTAAVSDPDFWGQPSVSAALHQVLGVLTGDEWAITFRRRDWGMPQMPQPPLALRHSAHAVIPFSGGLDSRTLAMLRAREGDSLILVKAGHKADRQWRRKLDGRQREISVPIHLSDKGSPKRFREHSYRSRGFVFGVMSGVAAYLSGCEKVLMPESGQGALGLWLVPVGNEAPDVRNHPLFTHELGNFLEAVLGGRIDYCFPNLWRTKGETLALANEMGVLGAWWTARSCARDARTVDTYQCGICSACLLRRQSLLRAGLDEQRDRYCWRKLSAPTVESALKAGLRTGTDNDKKYAVCGALSLEQLSRAAADHRLIQRKSFALSRFVGLCAEEVEAHLQRMVSAHANEWRAFVAQHGAGSYLAEMVEYHG